MMKIIENANIDNDNCDNNDNDNNKDNNDSNINLKIPVSIRIMFFIAMV